MKCIRINGPEGTFRMVPLGTKFILAPGEVIMGSASSCDGSEQPLVTVRGPRAATLQEEMSAAIGTGFGDLIKKLAGPFARAAGKGSCTSCEARRLVTNAYATLKESHGPVEALVIIKDLWALSFKATGDEVLKVLKEKLDDRSKHGSDTTPRLSTTSSS